MTRILAALLALAAAGAAALSAQIQMPDARQMSGIPRPVTDLPGGTISVRLIRGDLSNNITGHPVELFVDGVGQTVKTDETGRAQFSGIAPDKRVRAVAVVDGERLESQEFAVPAREGIRLLLVATDKEKEAQRAAEASAPAVQGEVELSGETRIVIEPDDEQLRVFYLLEIMNSQRVPVELGKPFMFEVPAEAIGTTIMRGSSPNASASGTVVRVTGPFPPGPSFVQVGFGLPARGGSVEIAQQFPATLNQLAVAAQKVGRMSLSSRQLTRMQEMPSDDGQTYIAAVGGTIKAGEPIVLSVTGLPYHSRVPRWTALALVFTIVAIGVWSASRPVDATAAQSERKRLLARREKLLQELVRLEHDHRRGKVEAPRFETRREELLAALERVYGALDTDDTSPGPADQRGLAA